MTRIFINKSYPFLGFYTQLPVDPKVDTNGNVVREGNSGRKYRFAGGIFDIEDQVKALGLDDDEKAALEKALTRLEADPKSGVVSEEVALSGKTWDCDFCKKPHKTQAALFGHLSVHKSAAAIADESVAEGRNHKDINTGVNPEAL